MTKKYFDDTDLIDRVKSSSFLGRFIDDSFAQNFYAAFCNMEYTVDDIDVVASYSWRSSGGIVAEIRSLVGILNEDYMDWYCSGMCVSGGFVAEGTLTKEIESCLRQIGLNIVD